MTQNRIDKALIAEQNAKTQANVQEDYEALGNKLARDNINIEDITSKAQSFQIAIPSWGTGTGGTRFARFPGEGEPRNIFEKLEDSAVINDLSQATERVSPHFPWDKVDDFSELKQTSDSLGLKWDSINSNTFQDQAGQAHSFKYGSLSNTNKASRDLAIAHNLECIKWGQALDSKTLTVWVGDGSNHPGQQHFQHAFERYLESMKEIYAGLPKDWELHIEHKMFEPAFYSTIIQDWLSEYQQANDAIMASNTLKDAFSIDVTPILQMSRMRKGGAIDPIATYRASGYRQAVAKVRPNSGGSGSGIV